MSRSRTEYGRDRLDPHRGDLLARLQRWPEAQAEFERAAAMAQNARERELLRSRAAEAASHGG